MGNLDAPKAPAGWYPIEEGKSGERYWDGNAWTGDIRGLDTQPVMEAETDNTNVSSKSTATSWLIASLVFIVILMVVIATNTKAPETEAQKKERIKQAAVALLAQQKTQAAQAAAAKPVIPEGFTDAGNGMSYKFIDGHCDYLSCAHYQIYSDSVCSNVYVEGNTEDANGLIYGMTNDMIGVMNPGDSAIAELPVLENGATAVRITKIICH